MAKQLSEGTVKQYAIRIAKLEKAKVELTDAEGVFGFFKAEKLGESAEKTYLSAIKNKMGEDFPAKYQARLNELYKNQNKRDESQEISEKQKEKYVPFKELMEVQAMLAAKKNKTPMEMRDYLIVSLYTLNAPVRADYGAMKIVKRNDQKMTANALVMNSNPFFVFREYKTSSTYGTVKVPVSPELLEVLKEWFAYLGTTPEFLFQVPLSSNALSSAIADTFKRYTGKEVGVSLIRHAYITEVYPTLTTIKKKADLAYRMMHSKDRQEMYNLPTTSQ